MTRTVHPVIPPHVDYSLTELGRSLGAAFCGVWIWAEKNYATIEQARAAFKTRGEALIIWFSPDQVRISTQTGT